MDFEKEVTVQSNILYDRVISYANELISSKTIACKKHILAAKRFLRFLKSKEALLSQGLEQKKMPIYFDKVELLKINEWAKQFKHTKGVLANQRIELTDFQLFVLANIFCFKRMDGTPVVRKSYIQLARKNAKTQLLAIIASYFAYTSGQMEEVYIAGWGRDQSNKCYLEILEQLKRAEGELFKYQGNWDDSYHHITFYKNGSTIVALSKEARKTGDGSNPSLSIIDEYHNHETNEIVDSLETGDVARDNSLLVFITTAGYDLNSPCYREYKYCSSILDEDNVVENDEYFIMICELDDIDEVSNPKMWIKANPIVCSYEQGQTSLSRKYKSAIDDPIQLRKFLTKNLNIWVDQKDNTFIPNDKWNDCKIPIPNIIGQRVYIGTDISNKIDITAHGFEFPDINFVMQHSFIPEERLNEKIRTDKVPYDLWVKQGYITLIPGEVIDDTVLIEYIEDFVEDYELIPVEVCFDPWSGRQYAIEMERKGYTMVEVPQRISVLSEPTKNFRDNIYAHEIQHAGDPVLQFAINNAIVKTSNGNIMLDKEKSEKRIDPLAALINAHTRAMYNEPPQTYDPNEYASDEYLNKLWG